MTIVQAAGKSLSFLIDLGTAWLVLPAYSGEVYPPWISDGIDNRAGDSSVGFTAATKAPTAFSALLMCKNQASGSTFLEVLLGLDTAYLAV